MINSTEVGLPLNTNGLINSIARSSLNDTSSFDVPITHSPSSRFLHRQKRTLVFLCCLSRKTSYVSHHRQQLSIRWQEFLVAVGYQVSRQNDDSASTLLTLPDIWVSSPPSPKLCALDASRYLGDFTTLAQVAQVINSDFPSRVSSATQLL